MHSVITKVLSITCLALLACVGELLAQDANVVAMEYYLDSDPGVGNGTPIAITPGPAPETTFIIPAADLTPGFHQIVVRAKDENDLWSTHETQSFFVSAADILDPTAVDYVEYYLDTDPGYGNGIPIPVTAGLTTTVTYPIPAASLTPGFHILVVRARDEEGDWSTTAAQSFYVHTSLNMDRAEYFFDTDPGVGSATPLTITSASELDYSVALPASSLPEGEHTLGVRVGREDDFWGETYTTTFSICTPPVPDFNPDVVCVGAATTFTDNSSNASGGTYSWDFDGDGIEDDATNGTTSHTYSAAGTYDATLTINRFGCTEVFTSTVTVDDLPTANAGADQELCTDATTLAATTPAAGESGMWTIVSGTGDITDPNDPATAVTSIGVGTLALEWTVTNTAGGCSTSDQITIVRNQTPVADFATDIVCEGGVTTFTDNSTNASGGSYSWDFDDDGVTDSSIAGNTSFIYPAAGTYAATLTIDVSGCIGTVTADVTVAPPPVANAGSDQDLCENETTLEGNSPAAGEAGLWSVVSGTATITNPTDPATTLTNITSLTTVLEWTITNSSGGCSESDQVMIISNQPITVGPASGSVTIGESGNFNVQNEANTNSGDVLTTSIEVAPENGTAVVESNGTITYTPAPGATGSDVIGFVVCNQCGHCASNNLEIDIINNPPVITPPDIVVAEDGMVVIDLLSIIYDANNNLDPSSLEITEQPISGALATIDDSYVLSIDYTGVIFSGTDQLTVKACDLVGDCSDNVILIQVDIPVAPSVIVYNAVSPNGDGKHDFLELENIQAYPGNHVYIINRWGAKVWEGFGYDNDQVRFQGMSNLAGANELPSGTYYYSVDLGNGESRMNGFFLLKR